MVHFGFRIYNSLNGLSSGGILTAAFNGLMIGVSVPTLVLIYGHQKVGSISAASIGVISIVLSYILYGFFPIALIENMIVVGLAYLEYRRVKAIEDFKPSNETDEQTTTDNKPSAQR